MTDDLVNGLVPPLQPPPSSLLRTAPVLCAVFLLSVCQVTCALESFLEKKQKRSALKKPQVWTVWKIHSYITNHPESQSLKAVITLSLT